MSKNVKAKTAASAKKVMQKKKYNGREVIPVIYNGFSVKHGSYVAAKYVDDGNLVFESGVDKPLPYYKI